MNLGEYLRFAIQRKDKTQKEIASTLYIAPQTLNGYLQNRRYPDYQTMVKIINELELDANYIFQNKRKAESFFMNQFLFYFKRLKPSQKQDIYNMVREMHLMNK